VNSSSSYLHVPAKPLGKIIQRCRQARVSKTVFQDRQKEKVFESGYVDFRHAAAFEYLQAVRFLYI